MMNRACRKNNYEYRRILLDIKSCPQIEKRFGTLNKLQHRFRKEQDEEAARDGCKQRCSTRIWPEDGTLVIQYKFDEKELYRTLDTDKHYPEMNIPQIKYQDKTPWVSQPKPFKFQGTKTPPGRARSNKPIRRPEGGQRIARAKEVFDGSSGSGASKQVVQVTEKGTDKSTFMPNLLDLKDLDPLAALDPLIPGNRSKFDYDFQVPRRFHNLPPANTPNRKRKDRLSNGDSGTETQQTKKVKAVSRKGKTPAAKAGDISKYLSKTGSQVQADRDSEEDNYDSVLEDLEDTLGLGSLNK